MDTSRMRVTGEGERRLRAREALAFRLAPKAEVAAVLQPGHAGAGERQDHRLQDRRRPGGVAETIGRQLFSLILVPMQKLTEREIPRDGSDICANAIREALRR